MSASGVYLELFKKSFLEEYIYKANLWLKILRNVIYIFIAVCIWTNLLKANEGGNPGFIKLNEMVGYVIVTLLIRNLVESDVSRSMAEQIRDGSIIFYFTQPINFNLHIFSYQFGKNLFETVFSTLPVCLAAYFFWGPAFFAYPTRWPLFLLAVGLSVVIMFYLHSILGLLVFWLKSGAFIDFLVGSLFEVFGGTFIPLWFYPPSLVAIGNFLPFRLVVFEPIQIYLGKVSGMESIQIILLQIAWVGALFVLEKLVWRQAQKVVTIQGG
jgi:ABC-2 type transport system permease protein